MKRIFAQLERHHLLFFFVLILVFILRFPSLYEPFWYGDEGIFAAVAKAMTHGAVLYQQTWDNKPPMIYLTYAGIFSVFGVSMFWLRLVTAVVVLATAATIYEIGRVTFGRHRAILATLIFGVLTSLRLIEGNLALTEIYMILPISLAMYIAIRRNFAFSALLASGFLFAIASLYKQVGAFEAGALGLYLFLNGGKFVEFIKRGFVLTVGFMVPYLVTILYFASKGIVREYIFGAYLYYKIYLGDSPQYALLINIAKYLPVTSAFLYGLFKKLRGVEVYYFHLFLLWGGFSFLGSYFSGRTYGHYLIQTAPAISLLLATTRLDLRSIKFSAARLIFIVVFVVPIIFLTNFLFSNFLSGGPINQVKWWQNFLQYAQGKKTVDDYNNFFDRDVNTLMGLADSLKLNGGYGSSVYIWGDYAWLYAIDDAHSPSRYVTSFHVGEVPTGYTEVSSNLFNNSPKFIIKPQKSAGYFADLENLLALKYTLQARVDTAEVYTLRSEK